jgi:DNA mismatch repair ATPase MutS
LGSCNFEIDSQTLNDLGIFNNGDNKSIRSFFGKAKTLGGVEKFNQIFNSPLTDPQQMQDRLDMLGYFQSADIEFNADKATCDFAEFYLEQHAKPRAFPKILGVLNRVAHVFYKETEYYTIQQGVRSILKLLNTLKIFTETNEFDTLPKLLKEVHSTITQILNDKDFSFAIQLNPTQKLSALDTTRADYLFRNLKHDSIKTLLGIVYMLDVFTTVSSEGKKIGFSLPVVNSTGEKVLKIDGLFHPFVNNAVSNNITFDYNQNVCFVTGTNMAGKSTFLKATGICVFLSQLGFPVPAAYMETSTFKGIITTINLSDDIQSGHSHFYNEVLRVKHVAQKLNESQDMFVIFDELFRGTNVKDAYDASLMIISAFSKMLGTFFMISTHIVEVANDLADTTNINFKFMETTFENETPRFSYQLKDGITDEKLGMWIVKNEGIVELIDKAIEQTS